MRTRSKLREMYPSGIHSPRYAPDLVEREERLATLKNRLGEAVFRVAWSTGRAMEIDEAIQLALLEVLPNG